MRKDIFIVIIILIISLNGICQSDNDFIKYDYTEIITHDSINGIYIPKDLKDCMNQIDGFLNDTTKSEIKIMTEDEFSVNTHFGLGMWMRNNWGLWSGSRLQTYFANRGIYHPDEMSSIILTSYHRYLTEKKIRLSKQIKYYKSYWNSLPQQFDARASGESRYSCLDSALIHSDSITKIHITGYKKIPSKIINFKNLNELIIEDCPDLNFHKTFKRLSILQNLNKLDLCNNHQDEYPKSLGNITQLKELWISDDSLSFLPNELKKIVHLEGLLISNCPKINLDTLFNQLRCFVNLESLDLWDNNLTNIPFSISNLVQLKNLSFDYNQLTEIPEGVKSLQNLESLDLFDNQIESIDLDVDDLPNLTSITLCYNNFKIFPIELSALKNLECILIWHNEIDKIPDDITKLNKLHHLNLQGNNLTDEEKEKLKIQLPNTKLKL